MVPTPTHQTPKCGGKNNQINQKKIRPLLHASMPTVREPMPALVPYLFAPLLALVPYLFAPCSPCCLAELTNLVPYIFRGGDVVPPCSSYLVVLEAAPVLVLVLSISN